MYLNRLDRSNRFQKSIPNLVPETGADNGYVFYKAKDDDTEVDDDEGYVSEIIYSEEEKSLLDIFVSSFVFNHLLLTLKYCIC